MSGYSKTPLIKKLGIKEGFHFYVHDFPEDFPTSLGAIPENAVWYPRPVENLDFIHCFVKSQADLDNSVPALKTYMKKSGMFWISWPKGKSGIQTDIKENDIRNFGLSLGLVDIKVAAVDDIWSGLKFVYRIRDR